MAKQTHQGSCHCGKVQYEVDLDLDAATVMQCNCSMCARAGWLLTFVTPDAFRLVAKGDTTDYLFNKHSIHHLFCSTCGIKSFSRGEGPKGEMIAINVRCLEGVEPSSLKVTAYDGRAH